MITQDELTDVAYQTAGEFEPAHNYDVFDITDSSVTFQDERGLFTLHVNAQSCESARQQHQEQASSAQLTIGLNIVPKVPTYEIGQYTETPLPAAW